MSNPITSFGTNRLMHMQCASQFGSCYEVNVSTWKRWLRCIKHCICRMQTMRRTTGRLWRPAEDSKVALPNFRQCPGLRSHSGHSATPPREISSSTNMKHDFISEIPMDYRTSRLHCQEIFGDLDYSLEG